ncbi:MAG: 3-dehydroquinate synthase [Odoribacteraceae bacterium]|jgi:3-dehydroquinate synthase|nr:3-dehydroquinate synthase [Odoribacteraceae bacterium]
MEEITLHGSRIITGECAGTLDRYLPVGRVIIITNAVVRALHGKLFPPGEVIEIGDGEHYKTLETIDYIAGKLVELEADRDTFILGVGGGIVCDVTGFIASIFMRGCAFGLVPTTLLAQVDAAVGGKNGVNHRGFKNMLGVFNQPRLVACDPLFSRTLPLQEYVAGFAEIVKAAMIADASLFRYLEEHVEQALERQEDFLQHVVRESIRIKANIVAGDERERGDRRLLNLGHTFAHAIEKCAAFSHGQAVSAGLCIAARLSVRLGLASEEDRQRVTRLLERLGLPVTTEIPLTMLLAAARADKKKSGEAIYFVFPVGIGRCEARLLSFTRLEELVNEITTSHE